MYVQNLGLPEKFIEKKTENVGPAGFIWELRGLFRQHRPAEIKRHGEIKPFILKDLKITAYILLLYGPERNSIQMPYDGPYEVVSREQIYYTIKIKEKEVAVSIDQLKPAYVINDTLPKDNNETSYRIEVQVSEQNQHPGWKNQVQPSQEAEQPRQVRRSGQSVRFVNRYQAGFG